MIKKLIFIIIACLLISEGPTAVNSQPVTFPTYFPTYIATLPTASPLTGGETLIVMVGGSVVQQTTTSAVLAGTIAFSGIKVGVLSSSAATVNIVPSNYFLCLDPTSNAIQANLESSPVIGQTHLIKDCTGQAAAHNITIHPAAGNIDGASNQVLSIPFQSVAVTYTGTQWSLN